MRLLFLICLMFSFGTMSLSAQVYPGAPDCVESLPLKIADFIYSEEDDLKTSLADLRNEFKKYGEGSQAVIHFYGGRISRSNDPDIEIRRIKNLAGNIAANLLIRDMGYRIDKSLEFFIRPLPCTQLPEGVSDLRVDDVVFTDRPSKRMSSSELISNQRFRPNSKCAPAARAVRACYEGVEVEVFVVINEKGSVVFSRAINGHLLNRVNAANSAKEMKFTPFEVGGVPTNVSGTIRIVYSNPEVIVID